jgi:hypothetical protein
MPSPYTWGLVPRPFTSLAIFSAIAFISCTRAKDSAQWTEDAGAGPTLTARATLKKVKGTVTVKRLAADDWSTAVEDMVLNDSDKVRTGPGATAQLVFINGSIVGISEDALIGLVPGTTQHPSHADLTVLQGRVDAQVSGTEKSLSVSTPTATIHAGREIVFR